MLLFTEKKGMGWDSKTFQIRLFWKLRWGLFGLLPLAFLWLSQAFADPPVLFSSRPSREWTRALLTRALDSPLTDESQAQLGDFNRLFVLQPRDESLSGGTNYLSESSAAARCPAFRSGVRTATYRETLLCFSNMAASVRADQDRLRADLTNDINDWNRLHPNQTLSVSQLESGTAINWDALRAYCRSRPARVVAACEQFTLRFRNSTAGLAQQSQVLSTLQSEARRFLTNAGLPEDPFRLEQTLPLGRVQEIPFPDLGTNGAPVPQISRRPERRRAEAGGAFEIPGSLQWPDSGSSCDRILADRSSVLGQEFSTAGDPACPGGTSSSPAGTMHTELGHLLRSLSSPALVTHHAEDITLNSTRYMRFTGMLRAAAAARVMEKFASYNDGALPTAEQLADACGPIAAEVDWYVRRNEERQGPTRSLPIQNPAYLLQMHQSAQRIRQLQTLADSYRADSEPAVIEELEHEIMAELVRFPALSGYINSSQRLTERGAIGSLTSLLSVSPDDPDFQTRVARAAQTLLIEKRNQTLRELEKVCEPDPAQGGVPLQELMGTREIVDDVLGAFPELGPAFDCVMDEVQNEEGVPVRGLLMAGCVGAGLLAMPTLVGSIAVDVVCTGGYFLLQANDIESTLGRLEDAASCLSPDGFGACGLGAYQQVQHESFEHLDAYESDIILTAGLYAGAPIVSRVALHAARATMPVLSRVSDSVSNTLWNRSFPDFPVTPAASRVVAVDSLSELAFASTRVEPVVASSSGRLNSLPETLSVPPGDRARLEEIWNDPTAYGLTRAEVEETLSQREILRDRMAARGEACPPTVDLALMDTDVSSPLGATSSRMRALRNPCVALTSLPALPRRSPNLDQVGLTPRTGAIAYSPNSRDPSSVYRSDRIRGGDEVWLGADIVRTVRHSYSGSSTELFRFEFIGLGADTTTGTVRVYLRDLSTRPGVIPDGNTILSVPESALLEQSVAGSVVVRPATGYLDTFATTRVARAPEFVDPQPLASGGTRIEASTGSFQQGGETFTIRFPRVDYEPPGVAPTVAVNRMLGRAEDAPLTELGRGGMRIAYIHPDDPTRVIKIYNPERLDSDAIAIQIQRERALYEFDQAHLRLAYATEFRDHGISIMERSRGMDLRDWLRSDQVAPEAMARMTDSMTRLRELDIGVLSVLNSRYPGVANAHVPITGEGRYGAVGFDSSLSNLFVEPGGTLRMIDW